MKCVNVLKRKGVVLATIVAILLTIGTASALNVTIQPKYSKGNVPVNFVVNVTNANANIENVTIAVPASATGYALYIVDPTTYSVVNATTGITPTNWTVVTAGVDKNNNPTLIKAYDTNLTTYPNPQANLSIRFLATSPLTQGTYTWKITVNGTVSFNITTIVDNLAPTITINKPNVNTLPPNTVINVNGTFEVNATVVDNYGVSNVTAYITNSSGVIVLGPVVLDNTVGSYYNGTLNVSALADGTYNLTVEAADFAGNIAKVVETVVVNNVPPVITINSPSNGAYWSGVKSVNATVVDELPVTVTLKVYNASNASDVKLTANMTNVPGTNYWIYALNTTTISDGNYVVEIIAKDSQGLVSNESVQIVIDNTPPVFTKLIPVNWTNQNNNIFVQAFFKDNLAGIDATKTYMLVDGVPVNAQGNSTQVNYTLSASVPWSDGTTFTITVGIEDLAGNKNVTTWTFKIDTVPPTKPIAKIEYAYGTFSKKNVTVVWNSSTDSTSGVKGYVVYWNVSGNTTWNTIDVGKNLSCVITGIPDNTTVHVYVRAYDYADNYNDSAILTTTVDANPPVVGAPLYNVTDLIPTETGIQTNVSKNIKISVPVTDNASGVAKVELFVYNKTGLVLNTTMNYNATAGVAYYVIPSLADGVYNVTINATDNVGLVNEKKAPKLVIDTTPPTIKVLEPNVTKAYWYNGTITINVNVTDNVIGVNYSTLEYRVVNASNTSQVILPWKAILNGTGSWDTIGFNGTALIEIRAADNLSNVRVVNVTVGVDNIPPTAPRNLTATVLPSGAIELSWTPASDVVSGVAGYQIYRNGSLLATVINTTTYLDTNIVIGKTYSYYVKAFDKAGNVGQASNTINVTTNATVIKPAKIVLTANTTTTKVNGTPIELKAYVADAYGHRFAISGYIVQFTIDNNSIATITPFTNVTNANGYAVAILKPKFVAGKVTVTAKCNDLEPGKIVITVLPDNATKVIAEAPTTVYVNEPINVTVKLLDKYGNVVTTDNTTYVWLEVSNRTATWTVPHENAVKVTEGVATITFTYSKPGNLTITPRASISVESVPTTVIVKSTAHPNITVIGLKISKAPEPGILVNDKIEISVTAINTGTATGNYTTDLKITKPDGTVVTKEITFVLAPNETETKTVTYTPDVAGNYIVSVDNLTTTFTVLKRVELALNSNVYHPGDTMIVYVKLRGHNEYYKAELELVVPTMNVTKPLKSGVVKVSGEMNVKLKYKVPKLSKSFEAYIEAIVKDPVTGKTLDSSKVTLVYSPT